MNCSAKHICVSSLKCFKIFCHNNPNHARYLLLLLYFTWFPVISQHLFRHVILSPFPAPSLPGGRTSFWLQLSTRGIFLQLTWMSATVGRTDFSTRQEIWFWFSLRQQRYLNAKAKFVS